MATTYSVDADITAWDGSASSRLPTGASTFDAIRSKAYAEIGRRLARREPSVDQSVLGIVGCLKHSEVLLALHYLYFDAAAKVADDSMFRWRSERFLEAFDDEFGNVRIPDDTAGVHSQIRSVKTVPIWRR